MTLTTAESSKLSWQSTTAFGKWISVVSQNCVDDLIADFSVDARTPGDLVHIILNV
jgi:hypothetical protein